jgi:hypothetical protein
MVFDLIMRWDFRSDGTALNTRGGGLMETQRAGVDDVFWFQ